MLSTLEALGVFHPSSAPGGIEWLVPASMDTAELAERVHSLDTTIEFLRGFLPRPKLLDRLSAAPRSVDLEQLASMPSDSDLIWRAGRAWRVAMVLSERRGDLREAREEVAFLRAWRGLPAAFEEMGAHGSLDLVAGTVSAAQAQALAAVEREEPLVSIRTVDDAVDHLRVLVVMHQSVAAGARQALTAAGFSPQDFGTRRGAPAKLLKAAETRVKALEHRIEALESEAVSLAELTGRFEMLRDAAGLLLERLSAAGLGLGGDRLFLIEGWVRERDLESLERSLAVIDAVHLEPAAVAEGEEPPTALTESAVTDPYVMLTDMFGSPAPADPDPTPLMAPFYSLFLGICIGDAGYGAVVAAASALGLAAVKRRGGSDRLFKILLHGGFAAMLAGILLGAWFGLDRSLLPAFLAAPAGLLDSLVPGGGLFGSSKQFLYMTMALGIVQLSAGIVVNFVKRWRAGERLTAVLEQSGWMLSLVGLFPWLFNHYLLGGVLYDIEGPVDGMLLNLLLAGAVLIFIMGGREARGFGKFGLGAMAAYGIVNLLADALSYSRLFALSLSSGIIASVVNDIAGMLPGTDIPGLGLLISIPVLLFGHLFNIFMSVLGGFIHTARLQFVEFFGKFYEGTGTPFSPLRYNPLFVNIVRRKS